MDITNVSEFRFTCTRREIKKICDMIKGNESDVENIDFELQAKKSDKFLCFTLFMNLKNCSNLCNQMSDWDRILIKTQQFKCTSDLYWKIKIEYCRHVTLSPWSCHICVRQVSNQKKVFLGPRYWNPPSIGEYWNISGLPVLPENVTFRFFKMC